MIQRAEVVIRASFFDPLLDKALEKIQRRFSQG
jgi:hypothetical protein